MRFNKVINKALLQNMLAEFMIWHAQLLQYIVKKHEDPAMALQIKLSDLNQWKWQRERRQLKAKTKQRLSDGKYLSEQKKEAKESGWTCLLQRKSSSKIMRRTKVQETTRRHL